MLTFRNQTSPLYRCHRSDWSSCPARLGGRYRTLQAEQIKMGRIFFLKFKIFFMGLTKKTGVWFWQKNMCFCHLDMWVPLNREPQTSADTSRQAAKDINEDILEKLLKKKKNKFVSHLEMLSWMLLLLLCSVWFSWKRENSL